MRAFGALRRAREFAYVGRRGTRRTSAAIVALMLPSSFPRTRVGITVGKAVGGAVVRNRVRRRLQNALDRCDVGAPPFRDVVLIARPGAGETPFAALLDQVGRLLA